MSCITNMLYFVLVMLCVQSIYCHTYLSTIFLNNQQLSEGDCVRPHPQYEKDYPLPSVTAAEMTCGWLPAAAQPANRKCPIAAGSSIGIQWHHTSNSPSDDIIEATHKGPVIFYLAKSETGSGNVWFKIFEDGYTASDGKWGVDRLLAKGGRVDVTIPVDIAPGNYLLRGEILALHNAYDVGGVQPYVGCIELSISGSGSGSATPQGVSFPGAYTPTSPGMVINIYQAYNSYTIPGPAIYRAGSVATPTNAPTNPSTSAPTSAPTKVPTNAPTSAPTSTPTNAATSAPTKAPAATATPTSAPSSAPTTRPTSSPSSSSPSTANVKVGLNGGSSVWWVGAIVSGGGETTVKVEMMDSGSVKNWAAMTDMSYAYVFSASVQVVLPISLRLTSSSGKQVVLTNVFTSFSTGASLIDTGKAYSSSSSSPSSPSTSTPTTAPTAPTTAPSTVPTTKPAAPQNSITVMLASGSNAWWAGLQVHGGGETIVKVEWKDSKQGSLWAPLVDQSWAYVYGLNIFQEPPMSVRVTSSSGKQVTLNNIITSWTPTLIDTGVTF